MVLSPIAQRIKEKVERIGTPLKDWNINIYRGILTGYNEAFIIDEAKRQELIKEDPGSAEIIRPILRGRDIKRYAADWQGLYLLFIPWHFPLHNNSSIIGASLEAEREFERQYPAIFNHLLAHKAQLSNRNKAETGIRYEWYALQRWGANYWEDFYKQKIVWGNLNLSATYCIAEEGMFINAPCPMIVPANKYLLAILNSKLADYYIRNLGVTRNGGYFEYKPMFIDKLPVPVISEREQKRFGELIDLILKMKNQNKETVEIEDQVNHYVFDLYRIERQEINFIENSIL